MFKCQRTYVQMPTNIGSWSFEHIFLSFSDFNKIAEEPKRLVFKKYFMNSTFLTKRHTVENNFSNAVMRTLWPIVIGL